jgi:hypothetical protein
MGCSYTLGTVIPIVAPILNSEQVISAIEYYGARVFEPPFLLGQTFEQNVRKPSDVAHLLGNHEAGLLPHEMV